MQFLVQSLSRLGHQTPFPRLARFRYSRSDSSEVASRYREWFPRYDFSRVYFATRFMEVFNVGVWGSDRHHLLALFFGTENQTPFVPATIPEQVFTDLSTQRAVNNPECHLMSHILLPFRSEHPSISSLTSIPGIRGAPEALPRL